MRVSSGSMRPTYYMDVWQQVHAICFGGWPGGDEGKRWLYQEKSCLLLGSAALSSHMKRTGLRCPTNLSINLHPKGVNLHPKGVNVDPHSWKSKLQASVSTTSYPKHRLYMLLPVNWRLQFAGTLTQASDPEGRLSAVHSSSCLSCPLSYRKMAVRVQPTFVFVG